MTGNTTEFPTRPSSRGIIPLQNIKKGIEPMLLEPIKKWSEGRILLQSWISKDVVSPNRNFPTIPEDPCSFSLKKRE
jgi:hypothetical protein